jgi:rhodanese-related sulfurtransferase
MPFGLEDVDPKRNEEYFRTMMDAEVDAVAVIGAIKKGQSDFQLVDVRDEDSYRRGHVEGAVNIPLTEISKRMGELDKDKGLLVYCYDPPCMASVRAARVLSSEGFKVKDVGGGFENFQKNDAPIVKGTEAVAR